MFSGRPPYSLLRPCNLRCCEDCGACSELKQILTQHEVLRSSRDARPSEALAARIASELRVGRTAA